MKNFIERLVLTLAKGQCQDCGFDGADTDLSSALHQTASAIGDGIDWWEGSLFSKYKT